MLANGPVANVAAHDERADPGSSGVAESGSACVTVDRRRRGHPQLAGELIRQQFPDLAGQQLTMLATGWDNVAFLVGSQWLFRFPRRQIAVPGVQREIAVLPRLAARLPVPVPDPQFIGVPSPRYPWPFFGARLLPGRELADSGLTGSRRGRAAASVGHFLRALHEPGLVALVGDAGLPVDPMRRATPSVRAVRARQVLDRLLRSGIWPGGSEVSQFLDQAERGAAGTGNWAADPANPGETQAADELPGAGSLVVCHGDLHVRHVLVARDGSATGVIDWGDLCLADPAVDLSIAYFGFAGRARADLLSAYGRPVSAQRELAARTCAISLAASLAEYAADDGRAQLLQECLLGIRRAVAA